MYSLGIYLLPGSLKTAYLLLELVWKAGQTSYFCLHTVFKILNGGKKKKRPKKRTFSLTTGSGMSVYVAVG